MAAIGKKFEDLLNAYGRLSRREKIMVGGLAAAFVIFVGLLVSLWISARLGSLESRIREKTDKIQKMVTYRQEYLAATESQDRSLKVLEEARNIQLMGTLENLAKQLGIDVNNMQMVPKAGAQSADSRVEEEKVEVSFPKITIDRLVDFLEQIQQRSRSIAIRMIKISMTVRSQPQLDVKFTVSKFQAKEEKEKEKEPAPSKEKAPDLNK